MTNKLLGKATRAIAIKDSVYENDTKTADQISRTKAVMFPDAPKEWWKESEKFGEMSNEEVWYIEYNIPAILAEQRKQTLEEVRKTIIDSYCKEYGGVIFFSKALDLIDSMINE